MLWKSANEDDDDEAEDRLSDVRSEKSTTVNREPAVSHGSCEVYGASTGRK